MPAERSGRVQISNVSGSVKVQAWDRAEIDVQARLWSGLERIDISQEKGRSVINVVLPQNSNGNGGAELEVRVPAESQVEVAAVSAPIITKGVHGAIRLQSVSGSIESDVAVSEMDAKTVSGSIVLHGNGQPAEMRLSTVSGGISLTHSAGSVEANTTSGSLDLNLEPARLVRVRTISGALTLSGRLSRDARIEAETVSGRLSVQAAAEGGFQYDVATFSGGIQNCFGAEAVRTSEYAPGRQLNGKRGAGQASVRLKALSGGIDLCDR